MKKQEFKLENVHLGYGWYATMFVMVVINRPVAKQKRAVAVLNVDKLKTYGDFSNKMKVIRTDMKNNVATFTSPPIQVADNGQFDNDIKAMDAAETTALSKAKGTASARDVTKQTVLDDAHGLQGYVQFLADKLHDTQKAVALIQLSGFDVSLRAVHTKSDFTAQKTKISGQVKLAINVKKFTNNEKRFSIKWQSSIDGGKTPVDLPITIKGSTLVSNLAVGAWMWFRFLVVLKDGEHAWSNWIKVMVE
jgi:hypothetical protein